MKRLVTIIAVAVIFTLNSFAQENNEKRHNFGIGVSSSLSSSTNKFLKNISDGDGIVWRGSFGKVDKNIDLNLSLLYEFNLNKSITFGVSPTFRFSRMEINYRYDLDMYGETTGKIYDIEIPLFADYKFRIMGENKLFVGAGLSGLFNIDTDSQEIAMKNTFSPYLLFRLGFDVMGNHRVQFLMQYRYSLSSNTYYDGIDYNLFPIMQKEYFRINTFDVGVNFFF